jgi:hypothetical protein
MPPTHMTFRISLQEEDCTLNRAPVNTQKPRFPQFVFSVAAIIYKLVPLGSVVRTPRPIAIVASRWALLDYLENFLTALTFSTHTP